MSDSPYPGLRSFQRHETDIFFGREEHTDQLIEKLGHTHFIAVVGSSGCGKSSLVRTGLLAGLETGFLVNAGVHWRVAEFCPGNHPFLRLAESLLAAQALGKTYTVPFLDDKESLAFLQASLHRGSSSLHEILQETPLPEHTNLLLLVDQFEEIFHYYQQGDADKAAAFVALLLASCQHPSVYIVITMRSDFIGDSALFDDLPTAIDQGLFLTPRLTHAQLRDAIEEPSNVFGGEVEPALVNKLLNEMGNDPERLPLLQHALMRMWNIAKVEHPQKVILTLQHYEKIGSLAEALSKHADEAYAELDSTQQRIAEILFCSLIEQGNEYHHDIRCPVKLEEIASQANVSWQQIAAVVEVFRQAERCFLTPVLNQNLNPNSVLDISHENLIYHWQRLKEWIQKEAESAKLYHRLEKTACHWYNQQSELWSGIELEITLAWQARTHPTAIWAKRYGIDGGKYFDRALLFLEASAAKQRKEQAKKQKKAKEVRQLELKKARKQTAFLWLTVGLIVAVGLSFWVFWEHNQAILAKQQTDLVKQQTNLSKQQIKQVKKEYTLSLFESQLTHATLLARDEDYAKAKKILKQTYHLDTEMSASHRHSRNLLAWFSELMGDGHLQVYKEAGTQLFVVAHSPNHQVLATAGESGYLVLFDTNTGQLLKKLQGHQKNIQAIVFHPKEQWLASAGDDKRIIFWSLTGDLIKEWIAPAEVKALAINPDGTQLASGGTDKNVTLWEIETGKPIIVFKGHKKFISTNGLTFNSTGELLASASHDNTARLWEVASGNVSQVLKGHIDKVSGIAFSPDNQQVATCSVDEDIRLWDVVTGKTLRVLRGHKNAVWGLRFFVIDGRHYLVSVSQDRTVRIWDTASGITLRVLQGHTAGITDITLSDKYLFTASNDRTVMRWRITLPYQFMVDLPSEPASTAIAPDGKHVAVGFADGALRWYSLPEHRLLWEEPQAHTDDIQRLVFSPKDHLLASASFDTTAKLWQIKTEKIKGKVKETLVNKQVLTGHHQAVNAIIFSPDARMLATASYDGRVGLFKVGTDQKSFQQIHKGRVYSVDFDKSGQRLLTSGKENYSKEGYTHLWEINLEQSQQEPLTLLKEFHRISDKLFWSQLSPDNQWVVSVGRDWLVHISTTDLQQQYHLVGHENSILRAIFSPDSTQIATVSGDATLRFWNFKNKEELLTLRLPSYAEESPPLWDFDFRCTPTGCWIAVPLTRGKLVLYQLGKIYD
ncbi:hypothetical protein [Candidatus Parabeggiatoa sp. HSG14]|uniref:WD40 repeat domain-containing protein n=1 Tax=Candidatus Parabeggiatoa sp. HSG14 TaxID=3055593 RepID=UPI0025A6FADE|nr:hypothetical protein [Thiotrichales bacterium HSG14]